MATTARGFGNHRTHHTHPVTVIVLEGGKVRDVYLKKVLSCQVLIADLDAIKDLPEADRESAILMGHAAKSVTHEEFETILEELVNPKLAEPLVAADPPKATRLETDGHAIIDEHKDFTPAPDLTTLPAPYSIVPPKPAAEPVVAETPAVVASEAITAVVPAVAPAAEVIPAPVVEPMPEPTLEPAPVIEVAPGAAAPVAA